jgi:hypothetical protein
MKERCVDRVTEAFVAIKELAVENKKAVIIASIATVLSAAAIATAIYLNKVEEEIEEECDE